MDLFTPIVSEELDSKEPIPQNLTEFNRRAILRTGRVVESQTLFRLKLVGKGALCPAPMIPPEGRRVAAEKVEMMRRNRLIQQDFTRSRTCIYFWFRARVT